MAERNEAVEKGFRPTPKLIVSGVVGVLLVLFVATNTESTEVSLLITTVTLPLWLVLVVVVALSFGVGFVLGGRGQKRKTKG